MGIFGRFVLETRVFAPPKLLFETRCNNLPAFSLISVEERGMSPRNSSKKLTNSGDTAMLTLCFTTLAAADLRRSQNSRKNSPRATVARVGLIALVVFALAGTANAGGKSGGGGGGFS